MDNTINFKGAFIVKKPTPALREFLTPKNMSLGKKPLIFENFAGKDDILYVVNDAVDKRIATTLIQIPDICFKYYPKLNLQSGFKKNEPSLALEILSKAKDSIITTKAKLMEAVRAKSSKFLNANIRRIHAKNLKLIEEEKLIIGLNDKLKDKELRKDIDVQTGVCRIFTQVWNPEKRKYSRYTLLEITPPGEKGYCYARYTPPLSENEKTRRIAIRNGKKIFEYTEPASAVFRENESNAKKYYQQQLQNKW